MHGKIERNRMKKNLIHPNVQPLKDIAAKIVLGKSYNQDILENLLSSIIQEPVEIVKVDVESSWIGSKIEEKITRSDIKIETKKAFILLELQNYPDDTYDIRITGYVAKCIIEQLERGTNYQDLKKVIVISISDHCDVIQDMPGFYGKTIRVLDEYRNIPVFNMVEHYILDIEKYRKCKVVDLNNPIHQWAEFFKYEEEEKLAMVAKKNVNIQKALEEYDRLMGDEEIRKQLESIREARQERRLELGSARYAGREQGLKEGREKGIKEGIKEGKEKGKREEKLETIKYMLKEGASDEFIIKVARITKQELQKEKAVLGI